jgi:glucan 1,3-beta-glucosidase
MQRRDFLKRTLGAAAALAAAGGAPQFGLAQDASGSKSGDKLSATLAKANSSKFRGVNLGGWLVLERWMVPGIYRGTDAQDEYSLCQTLGDGAKDRLDHHRETFITAEDFKWIANCGLNAVRLPVGYWALEAPKPYVPSATYIDFALEQAQANGLKLLLDLHGAPGSQNGWDHSGRSGPINWPKDPQNISETLRVLESFAQKYGQHPALCGIELLNEPRDVVPLGILQQFYQDAYARLRRHVDPQVAIVFHDSFRPLAWKKFMQEPTFSNVILDTHLYQCFDEAARGRTAQEQLEFAIKRKTALDEMQKEELPTIVGEWSLSLPEHSYNGLSPFQLATVRRGYADTQLLNYETTRGWFFWSYKLERKSEWNFRYCVDEGWLPGNFAV